MFYNYNYPTVYALTDALNNNRTENCCFVRNKNKTIQLCLSPSVCAAYKAAPSTQISHFQVAGPSDPCLRPLAASEQRALSFWFPGLSN